MIEKKKKFFLRMKIALLAAQKSKKVWIAAPSYLCSYH